MNGKSLVGDFGEAVDGGRGGDGLGAHDDSWANNSGLSFFLIPRKKKLIPRIYHLKNT